MNKQELKPCPCGATPIGLVIEAGYISKYANVSGQCCNEWSTEFITKYKSLDSVECMELAIQCWNGLPRANDKVTRFEVIDHSASGDGRSLVKYNASVELMYQDDGTTLKVILKDKAL